MFGLGIQGVCDCWGPVFQGADCDIIKRNVVSVLFEGFQFSPLRPSRQCSCASSVLSVWWLVVPTRSRATNGRDIWGKPKPFRNRNLFLLTCYALCFDDTSCIPASWTLVSRSPKRQPLLLDVLNRGPATISCKMKPSHIWDVNQVHRLINRRYVPLGLICPRLKWPLAIIRCNIWGYHTTISII